MFPLLSSNDNSNCIKTSLMGIVWFYAFTNSESVKLCIFNRSSDTITNVELKRWRLTFHTITVLEVEHS